MVCPFSSVVQCSFRQMMTSCFILSKACASEHSLLPAHSLLSPSSFNSSEALFCGIAPCSRQCTLRGPDRQNRLVRASTLNPSVLPRDLLLVSFPFCWVLFFPSSFSLECDMFPLNPLCRQRKNIGQVETAVFHPNQRKRTVYVGSRQGVVASLQLRSGDLSACFFPLLSFVFF